MENTINTISRLPAQLALIFALTLVGSQVTLARDNGGPFFGEQAKGKWIIGVKGVKIDTNSEFVDDADGEGVILGYQFDRPIGDLGGSATLELEYVTGDETAINGVGVYEADLFNMFMAYRSAGTLYFKAKAGLSFSDLTIITPASNDTFDEVSFAAGVGLGVRIGESGSIEIEYTDDTGDNDLGILGLNALLEF